VEDKIPGIRAMEKKAAMHETRCKTDESNICDEFVGVIETIGAINAFLSPTLRFAYPAGRCAGEMQRNME
jgi:hypothetical protein